MINWYKKVVFENYANFSGRARRSEYWYYTLMNIILAVVMMILDKTLGTNFEPLPYGYLYMIYALAVLVPGLAVAVRRLHDVGKSGWFFLVVLIPLVGPIWLLVLLCTDSVDDNNWGENPKKINWNE
ncbi:MAG: hypothetical protein RL607_2147 [Bacteroidota bacterium]|jgi:uncharacterized membrane protein YhaH (DUF805 family)